jgi:predicted ester cyclase
MTPEEMKNLFRRVVNMWETGDLSLFNEMIAPHYIGHVAAGDRVSEGLKTRIAVFRAAFPDSVFTIEDQLVDGDKVATRLTTRGTQHLTGEVVTLLGLNISRIAQGKIVEEWATWETLSD